MKRIACGHRVTNTNQNRKEGPWHKTILPTLV